METEGSIRGLYFEELQVGEVIKHKGTYTFTLEEQNIYAENTVNPAIIHLDDDYARELGFEGRIANGTHTAGVVMGLAIDDITQKTIFGNMEVTIKTPQPIYIGDTINVETIIGEKRESQSNPKMGIVYITHHGFKNGEEKPAIIVERVVAFMRTIED